MGYRRGPSRDGAEGGREGKEAGRDVGQSSPGRANPENDGWDDWRPATASSPPKGRRRRPWLRLLFALFLMVEALVLYLVKEYSPVFGFEITSVTVTGEDGVTTVRSVSLVVAAERQWAMGVCVRVGVGVRDTGRDPGSCVQWFGCAIGFFPSKSFSLCLYHLK